MSYSEPIQHQGPNAYIAELAGTLLNFRVLSLLSAGLAAYRTRTENSKDLAIGTCATIVAKFFSSRKHQQFLNYASAVAWRTNPHVVVWSDHPILCFADCQIHGCGRQVNHPFGSTSHSDTNRPLLPPFCRNQPRTPSQPPDISSTSD